MGILTMEGVRAIWPAGRAVGGTGVVAGAPMGAPMCPPTGLMSWFFPSDAAAAAAAARFVATPGMVSAKGEPVGLALATGPVTVA